VEELKEEDFRRQHITEEVGERVDKRKE